VKQIFLNLPNPRHPTGRTSLSGGLIIVLSRYAEHVHHSFSEGGDRGFTLRF